jgi:hypothetical protein
MGFRFYGTYQSIAKNIGNQYIIVTIDYIIKWVEAKAFRDNTTNNTTKFIYENIIISKTIEVLVEEFMIIHHKSTTYYL